MAKRGWGGARANSGGSREGAGRPRGAPVERYVHVGLDADLSALLATVEADGRSAADAVRWCIEHAVEHCEREAAELAGSKPPAAVTTAVKRLRARKA